jgi:hypothetical protein
MFQRDSRDNRLVNANTLATDDIIPEDEYRRRFDPSFGVRQGQQLDDPEMHNGDMQQCTAFACWSYCNGAANNGDGGNTTNAYDSRQEHTAADNARAVKRNQNRWTTKQLLMRCSSMKETQCSSACCSGAGQNYAPQTLLARSGTCKSHLLSAATTTPAGVLNRVQSGADLAKLTDGVTMCSSDNHTMENTMEEVSLQHATGVAFGRAQASQPRTECATWRTRRPPSEWWRVS